MGERVDVKPSLLRWAIKRSRLAEDEIRRYFPRLAEWQDGSLKPTLRQLDQFAKKTMTPLGFLFLAEPPIERLPIPDFRTLGDSPIRRPSPNLIDTIQSMQRRQAWMREFLVEEGEQRLEFVGSASSVRKPESLAEMIRQTLGLSIDWAKEHGSWSKALSTLRDSAERVGVLVAVSSIVGLNTNRSLDPEEFRGFVLCDEYAPLIFINGADSKSAQMFTLVHELAHVWVGSDGLFNLIQTMPHTDKNERLCNQTAAEFLVPASRFREHWSRIEESDTPFKLMARLFKVSPLVAARRALDLKMISRSEFFEFYESDQREFREIKARQKEKSSTGGPNFYDVQDWRLGRRFAFAVVRAAREGRLLYKHAYELTDIKGETFAKFSNRLMQMAIDDPW